MQLLFPVKQDCIEQICEMRIVFPEIFQDNIDRFAVLPKSLKVWLDRQPGERKNKKSSVVVEAPILKMEAGLTGVASGQTPAPMPKVVESFELAKILPGEGINLDDEDALNALKRDSFELEAFSGNSDAVSADFLPSVRASYQLKGITSLETEVDPEKKPVYTADQVTFFETDEYIVQSALPVLMTASAVPAEPFAQQKKETR